MESHADNHSKETSITGGCLCGSVRYEISTQPMMSCICYCRQCQKTSGSESIQSIVIPIAGFNLTQGTLKDYQVKADSGNFVKRCWCENCGSQLLAYPEAFPDYLSVKIVSLDDPTAFSPQAAIFTESAQPW